MSALADEMARLLWWYLLWLMRRPWMKRIQRRWLGWVRESRRQGAVKAVKSQNKLARRWGYKTLRLVMNLLLASVLVTVFYLLTLNLYESGAFQVPVKG